MRRSKLFASTVTRGVGIAAPATLVDKKLLHAGLNTFSRWQIPVQVDDRVFETSRYFAGSDKVRADLLSDLVLNSQIGTIWSARGGYGATRILSLLDQAQFPKHLRKNPKLLIGFSDVTALHFYFQQHAAMPSLHAPMPGTNSWNKMTPKTKQILFNILQGQEPIGNKSYTKAWPTKFLGSQKKSAEGAIVGGNLTLLSALVGTPWQPDLSGKILFLEDCAELPYRVDRMLTQLESAGMLKDLAGVLIGDFDADVVYREKKERKYWKEIFLERFDHVPVLSNLPVGHIVKNQPLPLGICGEITKSGKLILLESLVSQE